MLFHTACKRSTRSFRMTHTFYNRFTVIWQVLIILKTFSGLKTALHVNIAWAESLCCAHWEERLCFVRTLLIQVCPVQLHFHVQHFHRNFLLTFNFLLTLLNTSSIWLKFSFWAPLPTGELQVFPGCPIHCVWNILPSSACPAFFKFCIMIFLLAFHLSSHPSELKRCICIWW